MSLEKTHTINTEEIHTKIVSDLLNLRNNYDDLNISLNELPKRKFGKYSKKEILEHLDSANIKISKLYETSLEIIKYLEKIIQEKNKSKKQYQAHLDIKLQEVKNEYVEKLSSMETDYIIELTKYKTLNAELTEQLDSQQSGSLDEEKNELELLKEQLETSKAELTSLRLSNEQLRKENADYQFKVDTRIDADAIGQVYTNAQIEANAKIAQASKTADEIIMNAEASAQIMERKTLDNIENTKHQTYERISQIFAELEQPVRQIQTDTNRLSSESLALQRKLIGALQTSAEIVSDQIKHAQNPAWKEIFSNAPERVNAVSDQIPLLCDEVLLNFKQNFNTAD